MRRSTFVWTALSVMATAISLGCGLKAFGDDPKLEKLQIQFKIFDADDATVELTPVKKATIQYRSKVVRQPDIKFDLAVSERDAKGLYSVEVEKGWLIDRLVIRSTKANTNPAVVTKIVTANNMVVYPGASDSTEEFKFQNYMAQLGTYRDLYVQFVDEVSADRREGNRKNLRDAFTTQLENMANLKARIPAATPEQLPAAQKLLDEVLVAYGLRQKRIDCPPVTFIYYEPCWVTYPCPMYVEPNCGRFFWR
jgi:hypothetical protein